MTEKSDPGISGAPPPEESTLALHARTAGQGPPLLILHGLFGSQDNWATQTRLFSTEFEVITADLRNHGRSPHDPVMTYPVMAGDVVALLDRLHRPKVHVLGHSMGGKVAMQLALCRPARVRSLTVVDIGPVAYPVRHQEELSALQAVRTDQLRSRTDADRQLAGTIEDPLLRGFLLKNLARVPGRGYRWRVNLTALERNQMRLSEAPHGSPYGGPTLFVRGEHSDYLPEALSPRILSLFPGAQLKTVRGAGHWPHFDQAGSFHQIVRRFLLGLSLDSAG